MILSGAGRYKADARDPTLDPQVLGSRPVRPAPYGTVFDAIIAWGTGAWWVKNPSGGVSTLIGLSTHRRACRGTR